MCSTDINAKLLKICTANPYEEQTNNLINFQVVFRPYHQKQTQQKVKIERFFFLVHFISAETSLIASETMLVQSSSKPQFECAYTVRQAEVRHTHTHTANGIVFAYFTNDHFTFGRFFLLVVVCYCCGCLFVVSFFLRLSLSRDSLWIKIM